VGGAPDRAHRLGRADLGCAGGEARPQPPTPIRLAARVDLLKEEVFAVCGALALGEALLRRLGYPIQATHLATVFDLVEGRLAQPQFSEASEVSEVSEASEPALCS
jgi:hypothetical protein